jgi:hypothetical protein
MKITLTILLIGIGLLIDIRVTTISVASPRRDGQPDRSAAPPLYVACRF